MATETLKPKRNDPCPCGSGKKYKRCCHLDSPVHRWSEQLGEVLRVLDVNIEQVPEARVKGWTEKMVLKCLCCGQLFDADEIRKYIDEDGEFWLFCKNMLRGCPGKGDDFEVWHRDPKTGMMLAQMIGFVEALDQGRGR